jgi:chemotaxis protein methyltransferase CheR
MTSPAAALSRGPVAAAIRFADADFLAIARRVHADFGLNLPINKKDMVYSRLIRRLRDLGLHDFESYLLLLEGPGSAEEHLQLRSALTTNVTHFFRESHHFRMLRETVLPPLITLARSGGRVRIWSAGCSAGQEPYSLALTILDICPDAPRLDIRILATDVDPMVIAKARAGIYPLEEIKAIPQSMRSQLTDRPTASGDTFAIDQNARALIRFAELNLMEEWPMRGQIDIIFCRNVAIYFDMPTQATLWNRFGKLIPNGGFLFIGHSERLSGPATACLVPVGINTYCRTPETPGNPARRLREEL